MTSHFKRLLRAFLYAVAASTIGVATGVSTAAAQFSYNHTTFTAGFGSGPEIWQTPYVGLSGLTTPQYLARQVVLRQVGYPGVNPSQNYDGDRMILHDFLIQNPGQHVLVGHSLGNLIGRGTYIKYADTRPQIAGIVSVAAPHQGAPIADNRFRARDFFLDAQRRINDAAAAARIPGTVLGFLVGWVAGGIPNFGRSFLGALFGFVFFSQINGSLDLNQVAQLTMVPALPDMQQNAPSIVELNSRFDDAAIPRANVIGRIPYTNAAIRVLQSFINDDAGVGKKVRLKNVAQVAFDACKYVGYVTIIFTSNARRCGAGARALRQIDGQWVRYINGEYTLNGAIRTVQFDGVVPNDHQVYPGLNDPRFSLPPVDGVNHMQIYKVSSSTDRIGVAMRLIGMTPALAAAITGPTSVRTAGGYTWTASATGGDGSYAYHWDLSWDGSNWLDTGEYGTQLSEYVGAGDQFWLRVTVTTPTTGQSTAIQQVIGPSGVCSSSATRSASAKKPPAITGPGTPSVLRVPVC